MRHKYRENILQKGESYQRRESNLRTNEMWKGRREREINRAKIMSHANTKKLKNMIEESTKIVM